MLGFQIGLTAVIAVLVLASFWKIFEKMGIEGWKCLIPFYGSYTQAKYTCKDTNLFWALLGTTVASTVISRIALISATHAVAVASLGVAVAVLAFYCKIKWNIALAHSFGKSTLFGVMTAFFSVITIPMLAFGKAQYVGRTNIGLLPC